MKAIELFYGSGLLGTKFTHYSSDVLTAGETLYTREKKPVHVILCNNDNECTSLSPAPAYKCQVEGLKESGMVYDIEMLEHLNR